MNRLRELVVIILFIFLIIAMGIVGHEEAHAEICRKYGGNATIHYFHWPPQTRCYIKPNSNYILAQTIVDSFGYQMLPYMICGLFILTLMWFKS